METPDSEGSFSSIYKIVCRKFPKLTGNQQSTLAILIDLCRGARKNGGACPFIYESMIEEDCRKRVLVIPGTGFSAGTIMGLRITALNQLTVMEDVLSKTSNSNGKKQSKYKPSGKILVQFRSSAK